MALNQLKDTERKLQQLETAAKADQRNETFRQISTSLEANWLHVKTQIDNRVRNFTEPLTGIKRLLAKSSCYQMGDLFGDGEADERPLHEVCVDDIYLGKFEVIQAQWQTVMGYNPSANTGKNLPVDSVSWKDATGFTQKPSGTTESYRLPTELEW